MSEPCVVCGCDGKCRVDRSTTTVPPAPPMQTFNVMPPAVRAVVEEMKAELLDHADELPAEVEAITETIHRGTGGRLRMSRCFEGHDRIQIVCPSSCPCTIETRRIKRQIEQAIAGYIRACKIVPEAIGREKPKVRK